MSKKYNLISAFTPPPNGWVRARKDGKVYAEKFYEDFRTFERYQEYKECGFTEIMFAGETKYTGEPFETSELKMMLDLAEANDLYAIVFDARILKLTVDAQTSIIGELFDTEDELDDYLRMCLKDYSQHPAFYGVAIIDEPFIGREKVVKDIAKAMKRVSPTTFVHTCFNPLSCVEGGPVQETALGKDGDGYEAYGYYIDHMACPELGYFGSDDYPFKWWEGAPMVPKYITTQQFVAKRCRQHGLPFHMTIQSYANDTVDRKGRPRMLEEAHFNWLANIALGFGAKKIYYYTYWRFTTRGALEQKDIAIMDDDGSKILYDDVKNTNALITRTFENIREYEYEASQFFDAPNGNPATEGLVSEDLGIFTKCSSDAPLLLNKLTNGDHSIYMLLNARDPSDKVLNCVHLSFKKPRKEFEVLVNGRRLKALSDEADKLLFALAPGEAVWFLDL